MTNHWIDIRNSNCMLIIGSNAAENHPISFKYVLEAQDHGAKLIHVDPRYSRTSSKADVYVRIRSGTDIAFMGGMIYHILEDMRLHPENYNTDYVSQYTNAAYIVNSGIKLPGDDGQNGLFSLWDGTKYDTTTWKYADPTAPSAEARLLTTGWNGWTNRTADEETAWAELDDYCVLKLLWKHYRRYDKARVSQITGIPVDELENVYTQYARTGKRGQAGTIMYAMGATQHTYGTQNIRTYSIVQLLLANMGVAGGGINALRGTSNVQGSTDMCLLSHILPGYLKVSTDNDSDKTLDGYLTRITPAAVKPPAELAADNSVNWWANTPKYFISLLKAWWPDVDPETSYHYLPKGKASGVNYTHVALIEAMGQGKIDGLWVWGQNPAAGGPNSNGAREALSKLKWLVVSDVWMNETAEFWRRPGVNPSDIDTEVFVLPAAGSFEKAGTISNSGRWVQWRYRAVMPPGEALPDLDIMSRLMTRIKHLYQEEGGAAPAPILELDWAYGDEPTAEMVAREINGYALEDFTTSGRSYRKGELIDSFVHLQGNVGDPSSAKTSSGNWLYCHQYGPWTPSANGENFDYALEVVNGFTVINKTKRRSSADTSLNQIGLYSNWAWCWPVNRRIIYNRASVDLEGRPWDEEHPVLSWDSVNGKWLGDVVDGGGDPIDLAAGGQKNLPFIMNAEGLGRLWGYGLKDGPIPEVYEPWESPISNIMSPQQTNPAAFIGSYMNERGSADGFKHVGITYRCTEHWQTGIMTRNLPWLNELMPNMYVELGEDLANDIGIASGDKVRVTSARGSIEAVAVVTKRFRRLRIGDPPIDIDQVGIPWHWGYSGLSTGDSANILTPHVGDANTTIPEYKTFLCKVEKV